MPFKLTNPWLLLTLVVFFSGCQREKENESPFKRDGVESPTPIDRAEPINDEQTKEIMIPQTEPLPGHDPLAGEVSSPLDPSPATLDLPSIPPAGNDSSDEGQVGEQPTPAAACNKTPTGVGEVETVNLGGREFLLYIPNNHKEGAGLIVAIHGLGSNPEAMIRPAREIAGQADQHNYVVAYPRGEDRSFNAGSCCGRSSRSGGPDDVQFILDIVEDVKGKACIDDRKIFATGISNGGMMSHRLACEASDTFRAIAPVVGRMALPPSSCNSGKPLSVIAFNGGRDNLVSMRSAINAQNFWVEQNQCVPKAYNSCSAGGQASASGNSCASWKCADNTYYVQWSLPAGGHTWFTKGQGNLSATEELFRFFNDHARGFPEVSRGLPTP